MEWTLYPIKDFPQFHETWDDLNQALSNSPLLDTAFVAPLLDYFTDGTELIAVYGAKEQPETIAIIHSLKNNIWETLQPSNAPLGMWLSRDKTLPANQLRSLIKKLPGKALSFSITQQDPLFITRPENTSCIESLDYIETAHIDFPDSFQEYWTSRSKNLRHNMKRQKNYLRKNDITPRLETWNTSNNMHQGVLDYAKIESSGWKGDIDSAVAEGDAQSEFYNAMLCNFCRTNEALILRYYYNEDLVASDLCLLRNKVLYILKTTYVETVKSTSPAHIMRFDYYQDTVDRGALNRVEFYGPLKEWHKKWTNDIRTMFHTNIYRNQFINWARKISKLMR
tara:strand:- start:672 stop:1685 length:1014 start_codon:yes stop_codon:yes gene_type:complete